MSMPFVGPLEGLEFGRAAFGIGAIVTWLMFALMAYAGANKVFGKKR